MGNDCFTFNLSSRFRILGESSLGLLPFDGTFTPTLFNNSY